MVGRIFGRTVPTGGMGGIPVFEKNIQGIAGAGDGQLMLQGGNNNGKLEE